MRSTFRRASTLTEAELRALWRLRGSLIDLKPSVSPEEDFAAFAEDFRWGIVWILKEGDQVGGFFLQRALPMTWRGREILCLAPEYGFMARHLRGTSILPAATVLMTAACVARHPLRPKYLVGAAYPPSFISMERAVPPIWSLRDPTLPDWERGLLEHLGERIGKSHFSAEDGTVFMRTLPRTEPGPRSEEGRALFEKYERANPEWRRGRGLFIMCPMSAGTLARAMRHAADRRWKRFRRRERASAAASSLSREP